jgi:hypothetical protein
VRTPNHTFVSAQVMLETYKCRNSNEDSYVVLRRYKTQNIALSKYWHSASDRTVATPNEGLLLTALCFEIYSSLCRNDLSSFVFAHVRNFCNRYIFLCLQMQKQIVINTVF